MVPSTLLLASLYLAYLPSTTAWVFSWTEPSGELLTDHGSQARSCQKIDNPVGNVFDWSPAGDNVCIYLYGNTDCSDPSAGYTCKPWPWSDHKAGSHILSYEVVNNGTSGSSSSTVVSSTATTATTSSVATSSTAQSTTTPSTVAPATSSSASPSNTPGNTQNGSSLSGGAIAGIVVGVLAAVAIAGILFFFLCWRRRRPSSPAKPPVQSETAMSELQSSDEKPLQKTPPSNQSSYQQQTLRELPGSHVASEMGPGVERAELDGSGMYGKF